MENKAGILDEYWSQFVAVAMEGRAPDDDLSYERRVWFAGVVAVVQHCTATHDIDALVGRLGEIVRDLELISKREHAGAPIDANAPIPKPKPDPSVCYDGSS